MADDQNQRPYRTSDVPARGNGGGNNTASDPLAELARLIGQNDPFGEFGRDNASRPVPRAPEPGPEWLTDPANGEPSASDGQRQAFLAAGYGRQTFGGTPLPAGGSQLYQVDAHAPGYDTPGYEAAAYPGATPGYEEAFPPSQEPLQDVHPQFGPPPEDDYYDDVPPTSRRRISVLTIASVFALAIIGTAGAFGYRAMFGSSSSTSPPPVIKAEQTPSKIVPAPAGSGDALAGKAITDRVGGQGEKLVSREEQPVPVSAAPPVNSAFPPGSNTTSANAAAGSGIVGEPKKIRTITIRPDGASDATVAMAEPVAPAAPPSRGTNVTPVRQPAAAPQANPEPPRAATPQPAPEPRQAAAPPPPVANAPLSLNPNAAPPARTAAVAAPARIAPPTAATGASTGGYAVQVSARRSEADAQAAFQSLQSQFPGQLGNRQPIIKRVDLGEKGIFYRAMVGPFGSSGEAGELCSSLKAAGGSCIIQRN